MGGVDRSLGRGAGATISLRRGRKKLAGREVACQATGKGKWGSVSNFRGVG